MVHGTEEQRRYYLANEQSKRDEAEVRNRSSAGTPRSGGSVGGIGGEHGEVIMGAFLWAIYWAVTTLWGKFMEFTGLGEFVNSISVWLFGNADNVEKSTENVKGILYWLVGELNLFGVKWGEITWWDVLTWEPVFFLVFIPVLIAIFVPDEWWEPKKSSSVA